MEQTPRTSLEDTEEKAKKEAAMEERKYKRERNKSSDQSLLTALLTLVHQSSLRAGLSTGKWWRQPQCFPEVMHKQNGDERDKTEGTRGWINLRALTLPWRTPMKQTLWDRRKVSPETSVRRQCEWKRQEKDNKSKPMYTLRTLPSQLKHDAHTIQELQDRRQESPGTV